MNTPIRFASIGDCCADIYDDGTVKLGGTAYNVALAAQKAGAKTSIISAVGTDAIGNQFLKTFKKNRIDTSHLAVISGKTSSIPISLDSRHRPVYGTWDLAAMRNFHLDLQGANFLRSHTAARAVFFTPINYLFREFCTLNLAKTIKIGDFAGTSADSISASSIGPYAKYLDIIVKSVEEKTSLDILHAIAEKYNSLVLVLLGSQGSIVYTKHNTYIQPAIKVQTTNTTGAGDVYQAYFVISYLQTKDIMHSMKVATQEAASAIS